jgi:hypothetical protein
LIFLFKFYLNNLNLAFDFNRIKHDHPNNIFEKVLKSEKKSFKPYKMDWINDFVSGSEFNNFEMDRVEYDHFKQKGLILNFQKVNISNKFLYKI